MTIIAAYAGTGKTYCVERDEDVTEVLSMPHSWILKENNQKVEETEKEKGALYHLENPLYPMNMILDIFEAETKHSYVIIPTIPSVIKILQEKYHQDCILVYPKDELKEEYRQRYINRGNSESFIDLFVGGFEERLKEIKKLSGTHIQLKSGEYLSDKLKEIKSIKNNNSISYETMNFLKREIEEVKKNLVLVYFGVDNIYYYQIQDYDDKHTQQFLYDITKYIYEKNLFKPRLFHDDVIIKDEMILVKTEEEFFELIQQFTKED